MLYHGSTTKPQLGRELQGATSVRMNTRRAQRILQLALQRKLVLPMLWETSPSSEKHPYSAKYINASVRAHLCDGTLSHPACEISDTCAVALGVGPAGDTDGLGGDCCCVHIPGPHSCAALGLGWATPSVSRSLCLQLPAVVWLVMQSYKLSTWTARGADKEATARGEWLCLKVTTNTPCSPFGQECAKPNP